jgi:hypothetical protein
MKPTKATLKSFIKKNRAKLLINVKSTFEGMTDCVQDRHDGFSPITAHEYKHDEKNPNTLGIAGVWLVGHSRDYIDPFTSDGLDGFAVSNCCGSFVVAVATDIKNNDVTPIV